MRSLITRFERMSLISVKLSQRKIVLTLPSHPPRTKRCTIEEVNAIPRCTCNGAIQNVFNRLVKILPTIIIFICIGELFFKHDESKMVCPDQLSV